MPGLYGLYINHHNKDLTNKVFDDMEQTLKNGLTNNCIIDSGNLKYGNLLLREPKRKTTNYYENNKIVITIDGSVYSMHCDKTTHELEKEKILYDGLIKEYVKNGYIDIRKLNGEFNIILYDRDKNRIIIQNDRWGFRELYYYQDKNIFIFAPEVKALLCNPFYQKDINEQSIADFISCGYVLGDKTLLSGINQFPPASIISVDPQGFKINSLKFSYEITEEAIDFNTCIDKSFYLLEKSVIRRVRDKEKIALTLSGGLDSRIVAGILAKNKIKFDSFTFGEKEGKISRKVISQIPFGSNTVIKPDGDDIPKYGEWAVWKTDGLVNFQALPTFYGGLISYINPYDILLGGFVGDLILGGSFINEQPIVNNNQLMKKFSKLIGADEISEVFHYLFDHDWLENIQHYCEKSIIEEYDGIRKCSTNSEIVKDLYVILTRCRKSYNINRGLVGHSGTEEYYVFFDNEFFDFVFALPLGVRANHRLYIEIFKRYFPGLSKIPWLKTGTSLYNKPPLFSKKWDRFTRDMIWQINTKTRGIMNIPEKNQYAPCNYWYRKNKKMKRFIDSILLDGRTLARGLYKKDGVKKLLEDTEHGFNNFHIIQRICIIELWMRIFLDNEVYTTNYASYS